MATVEVSSENIREFYDRRYEQDYMEGHHWLESFRVSQTLDEISGDVQRILDYGCGQGRWSSLLAEKFKGSRISGIDLSNKAIEKAKVMYPEHEFTVFDGEKSPLYKAIERDGIRI